MEKKILATDAAPAAIGPYSQAVLVTNFLYTSGQIPLDPATMEIVGTSITEQTRQVMKNLRTIVENAGGNLSNIVKTTCFLKNMDDFAEFNEVYGKYFDSNPPSRSCVEVSRLPKDVMVEIEAIAVLTV
ncbi:RidA family protein [Desulfogranum japonicum]|uniref:RidA family protein n=1 Tax=Desulfogranum japonicum TaxID=231447 RepID=UPI0003FD3A9B|nr:RidA family protein [Desulfogranum japonicum]